MKQVRLIRLETNNHHGTFGVLVIEGNVFCCTLEPYDRANQKNISNIPAQQYVCKKYYSTKFDRTYEVKDVSFRSKVLFHPGNYVRNTKGCILLGQYFSKLKDDRMVANSGDTFEVFMKLMAGCGKFQLTIVECY